MKKVPAIEVSELLSVSEHGLEVEGQEVLANLSFDEAIVHAGGFGLYQVVTSVVFFCSIFSGSIIFILPLFEAYPKYLCLDHESNSWRSCEREQLCQNPETVWMIDYNSDESYLNFVSPNKLDLTCVTKSKIGMIGSTNFLGYAIGCIFIPRLADLYGRKKVFIICMWLQLAAYAGLYYSTSLDLTIGCFFALGLANVGRIANGVFYVCEFMPESSQGVICGFLNGGESSYALVMVVVFYFVRDW